MVSFGSSAETARRKIDAFYEKLRKLKSGGIKSGDTLDALNIKAPFTTSAATAESIAAARSSAIPPKFIPTPNAGLPPAFMATGGAGGTASVAAKAEGGILKNYLASIGKKTTDFEKVLKIEQTRICNKSRKKQT